MSPRPLVFVSGLTFCDYLLWSWSLNGNHDVLALISGLTLPPLAVAVVWLLLLNIARGVAHFARVRAARGDRALASEPTRRTGVQRPAAARAQEPAGEKPVAGEARPGKIAA